MKLKAPCLTGYQVVCRTRTNALSLILFSSETKGVLACVSQRSILGPLLFLIHVNDIAERFLSLTRLYGDDSSLFSLYQLLMLGM